VALVDIGGGTTDVAVYFGGSIRHSAVVGLGGTNVTSDIALGLRTPMQKAEELKIAHGCATASRVGADYEISVPGVGGRPPRAVSRQLLTAIIEPRLEEILTLAHREFKRSDYADLLGAGVVLTGGTSLLEGAADLAEGVFGHPVRVGAPLGVEGVTTPVDDPRLATAVGLALYGLRRMENGRNGRRRGFAGKMIRGLRRWAMDFV
jgi:cell division protein FtsA